MLAGEPLSCNGQQEMMSGRGGLRGGAGRRGGMKRVVLLDINKT